MVSEIAQSIISKKVREEDANVINFLFVLWMCKGNRKLILIIGVVMPCWLAGLQRNSLFSRKMSVTERYSLY